MIAHRMLKRNVRFFSTCTHYMACVQYLYCFFLWPYMFTCLFGSAFLPYQQKGVPTFEQNLHIDIYFAVRLWNTTPDLTSLSTREKQGNHVASAQITSSLKPAQLDTIPLLDK